MSYIVTFQQRMQFPGQSITGTRPVVISSPIQLSEIIAFDAADVEYVFQLDITNLKAFGMVASQNMTVETNSGGAPQDTFLLIANEPVYFFEGDSPIFAGDVTSIFVTNTSGIEGQLDISAGIDATV